MGRILHIGQRLFDHDLFFKYFRMSTISYENLLGYVGADRKKATTKMREPISPDHQLIVRLIITL